MRLTGRMAGYDFGRFKRDLAAGFVVGIIALPLGMGFAIASGVDPRFGLYTTIVAGFLISLLGGSKFQIGGPTGAFVPVLLSVVLQYGYANLLVAGFLAGVMLLFMGLCRIGSWIRHIPHPVITGFTAGIAVIIFSGQLPNALGLRDIPKHENFFPNMKELAVHIGAVHGSSVITAAAGLAAMIAVARLWPRFPVSLAGLAVSALVAYTCFPGRLDTIASVYGGIPNVLPTIGVPDLSWDNLVRMLAPAAIIAMLGGIESLLSAVVADGMSGDRHRSNRELIGQGVANMVTPFFGGIPATGAIARTAANIRSGAAGPVSGMVHSVTVLLILLVFAPVASGIPLAGMAPVLMMVAWNMSERKAFAAQLRKKGKADALVLLVTFALTVAANLTAGVVAGIGLAVLLKLAAKGRRVPVSGRLAAESPASQETNVVAAKPSHIR